MPRQTNTNKKTSTTPKTRPAQKNKRVNHQVLARKYRPKNFAEFIGQDHVAKTLINALENNRLHHAFLFTGTRGVGKTTVGRILAKCLNCQTGISAEPCGKCNSCCEIAGGQSLDLIEFDAASRTKVEDMREVLENAQYLPSNSRYKIYLIDEVHMLSKSSFNALLKTLEEPPSHVKFLLATTDPSKLPITILSRCLQFNLQKISTLDIQNQLKKILKLESIKYDDQALFEIAKHGQGSMRDALSLLDQAIAYGNGQVKMVQISKMLGLINDNYVDLILAAIINNDTGEMLALSEKLYQNGNNLEEVLSQLLEALHQLSILNLLPDYQKMSTYATDLSKYTKQINQAQIQLYYQIISEGIKRFALAPNEKIAFEITLLRVLAFNSTQNKEKKK